MKAKFVNEGLELLKGKTFDPKEIVAAAKEIANNTYTFLPKNEKTLIHSNYPAVIDNLTPEELFKLGKKDYPSSKLVKAALKKGYKITKASDWIDVILDNGIHINYALKNGFKPNDSQWFKILNRAHHRGKTDSYKHREKFDKKADSYSRLSSPYAQQILKILGYESRYDLPPQWIFKLSVPSAENYHHYDVPFMIYALEQGYKPNKSESSKLFSDLKYMFSPKDTKRIMKALGVDDSLQNRTPKEKKKDWEEAKNLFKENGFEILNTPAIDKRLNIKVTYEPLNKVSAAVERKEAKEGGWLGWYKKQIKDQKFNREFTIRNTGNVGYNKKGESGGRIKEDPSKTYVEHAQFVIDYAKNQMKNLRKKLK